MFYTYIRKIRHAGNMIFGQGKESKYIDGVV
jgi:hypothetical protein